MVDPQALPVPEAVAARARRLLAGELQPVAAKPAATVVLVRDSAPGLQVYVLRRRTTMAFAAGMYAFPGGRVDPADSDAAVDPFECAAVRELFEETTVLLAGPATEAGHRLVADTTGDDFDRDRRALVGRELSFSSFLARRGLVLRPDLLTLCGHWITPEAEERRYDTRFYLAAMPTGQRTADVSGEADRVAWLRPIDIEAAVHAGEMRMLPPTAATIAALVPYDCVASALSAARSWEIPTLRPAVEFDEADEPRWVLR